MAGISFVSCYCDFRGEILEVVDDSRKWWKCRNSRGQIAHVPHTIVTEVTLNHHHNSHTGDRSAGNSVLGTSSHPVSGNEADWIRSRQGKKGEFRYF